jgi:micrococcal nuclease
MKAIVNGITDGDTLTIGGATVRLALVDTPERGERGYTEATSFTSRMCPVGSEAIIDEDDGQTEGSYGRMIAKVYCIGGMINQKLLDFHHAVILLRHCEESEFGQDLWATKNGCAIA